MDIDTININVDVGTSSDPVEVAPTPAGPQGPPGPQGIPGERGEPGQPGRDGAIQYTAGDNITIDENNVISATGGDLSNYLAKDNTTSYTPSGDYNPATKKYVDDSITSAITDALGGNY